MNTTKDWRFWTGFFAGVVASIGIAVLAGLIWLWHQFKEFHPPI